MHQRINKNIYLKKKNFLCKSRTEGKSRTLGRENVQPSLSLQLIFNYHHRPTAGPSAPPCRVFLRSFPCTLFKKQWISLFFFPKRLITWRDFWPLASRCDQFFIFLCDNFFFGFYYYKNCINKKVVSIMILVYSVNLTDPDPDTKDKKKKKKTMTMTVQNWLISF